MTVTGLQRMIISVADREKSLALYRDALGLAVTYEQGDMVMLAVPGGDVEVLLHQRPPTAGMAGVAVSFLVDDVDTTTAAAGKAGASVVDPPADQPWGERQAVLTDPDGHVVCLVASTG
jgi:catechol 2,3-dioxygenase-like lactoylglutathione lyase family enzyme